MVLFTAAVLLECRSAGVGAGREDDAGSAHESRDVAGTSGWRDVIPQHPRLSGWRDLNPRPPAPKAGALPNCATPRGGPSLGGTAQRSRDGRGRRTYRRPMTRPAVGEMVLEDARALFDACRWRDCV